MSNNILESARQQRDELKDQIRILTARSGSSDRYSEELGIARASDRVTDLQRHLAQTESLLKAASDIPEFDAGWFIVQQPQPASGISRAP